jgi:uncharacterized protein YcbK (DUF882 family)
MKLTENFSLSEVFDWGKWQGLSATDNAKLTEWQKRDWNEKTHLPQAKAIAEDLQDIRNLVNKMFHEYNGKIGIRAVSWYRPKAWELHRKRSGASQHVTGGAVDFIITGVKTEDYNEIMNFIYEFLEDYNGGLARLYRNNRYSFIHIDKGRKRRWEY